MNNDQSLHSRMKTGLFSTLDRWKQSRRSVCLGVSVALLCQGVVSCAGGSFLGIGRGNKYTYAYTLTAPQRSQLLAFRDDSVSVQFRIDDSAIQFQLQNLSSVSLRILWNRASIGIDQRYSWARNSVSMYSDSARDPIVLKIPPHGTVRDLAIPSDNVSYRGNRWVETDLFPTRDGDDKSMANAIAKNVGKALVLDLPIEFGSTVKDYRFEFRIVSVKQILWSEYNPPKRNVPPPPRATSAQIADEVTTAFIVVGLLGFVAFMVSMKKDPVTE